MTLEDFVLTLNTAQMDIEIHLLDSHLQDVVKTALLHDSDEPIDEWLDVHFKEYKNVEIIDICPWLKYDSIYNDLQMADEKIADTSKINLTLMF